MAYVLAEICRRASEAAAAYNQGAQDDERVVRLVLIGSYANGEQNDESDIDLLVFFATDKVGLFSLARLLDLLECQFDVSVDLVQAPLPPDTLLEIDKEVVLYEAA